jgi:hypothetical protein
MLPVVGKFRFSGVIRMRSVGQSHERQQRPIILRRRVGTLLNSYPALYIGASIKISQPVCSQGVRLGKRDVAHLAWWKPTMHTIGSKGARDAITNAVYACYEGVDAMVAQR